MAPKVDTKKRRHCTGLALSEEVAPWNTGTARDQALPEDNGTLYPKGSLFVVNKDVPFLAELFRGMLFKWKGENKKSHQK